MRKKELLAGFLRATGGFRVATALYARLKQELIVLAYHRVLPLNSESEYPYDVELVSADMDEFDWQMSWISKNFNLVSVSEIADCVGQGRPLPAGSVAVTFDDGFIDNYTHAYPVLRRHAIPACVFLSTEFVGTKEPYWFEAVAQVLMRSPVGAVRLPAMPLPLPRAEARVIRREDVRHTLSALKKLPDDLRRRNMEALQQQAGNLIDATLGAGAHAMSWAQVLEMSQSGIEFGSHGTSHAILSRLGEADLARELTDSKSVIEGVTGKLVVSVAYPVGGEDAVNDRVVTAAQNAGYRIGFTYLPGANRPGATHPMRLRRQHVERFVGRAYFQGLLAFPSVFD